MVRPDFSDSMSPASCSTAKWADIVGFDTGKWSESSPADIGRSRNSCRTRRRVGSESALNTLFTGLYLAKHLNIVKDERRHTRNGLESGLTFGRGVQPRHENANASHCPAFWNCGGVRLFTWTNRD